MLEWQQLASCSKAVSVLVLLFMQWESADSNREATSREQYCSSALLVDVLFNSLGYFSRWKVMLLLSLTDFLSPSPRELLVAIRYVYLHACTWIWIEQAINDYILSTQKQGYKKFKAATVKPLVH